MVKHNNLTTRCTPNINSLFVGLLYLVFVVSIEAHHSVPLFSMPRCLRLGAEFGVSFALPSLVLVWVGQGRGLQLLHWNFRDFHLRPEGKNINSIKIV